MQTFPPCPQCNSEYTYEEGDNYICPECAHEWPKVAAAGEEHGADEAKGGIPQHHEFTREQIADPARASSMARLARVHQSSLTKEAASG